ncbi:MAG: LysM peptidoglycan-binding domain-containing protein [Gemmatimonadaceae bacterium]|nr:LysM peptidoglycan-binding domain-containing protein [Gemmatimonadaceae bacterium]
MPRLHPRTALAVLVLATATRGTAQDAPRTHTVKKGDTLWDIAKSYLGNPFQWPEIYRLNQDVVENPHWIYPGELLRLPGAAPADATATTAAETATPEGPITAPPKGTVFDPRRYVKRRDARSALILRQKTTAVRSGDYLRAPWLGPLSGPSGAGVVLPTAEAQGVATNIELRMLQHGELFFVRPPANATVGTRLMALRRDATLLGFGRVLYPTAVIRMESLGANGGPAFARVVQQFGNVEPGQDVVALDTLAMPKATVPGRVEFGAATTLRWIDGAPVHPGIAQQMIFAPAGSAITTGDQITVFRDRGVDAHGAALPPEAIAVAQVTRVTPQGVSATVLEIYEPGLTVGMSARVTAKMP